MRQVAGWVLRGHPGAPAFPIRLLSALFDYRLTKRLLAEGKLG